MTSILLFFYGNEATTQPKNNTAIQSYNSVLKTSIICQIIVILGLSPEVFPILKGSYLLHQYICLIPEWPVIFIQIIMCDTQTLAASTEGYIIRCSDCGRMQLCFGIVAAALKPDQFRRLQVHIAEAMLYGAAYSSEPDRRAISLPLNKTSILCLNRNELVAFEDLVSQANALMEVYELLAKG